MLNLKIWGHLYLHKSKAPFSSHVRKWCWSLDVYSHVFQNVAPNHRANDVIVLEDKPQVLAARFMYGPLDMVSLSGEKVRNSNSNCRKRFFFDL